MSVNRFLLVIEVMWRLEIPPSSYFGVGDLILAVEWMDGVGFLASTGDSRDRMKMNI